MLALAIDTATPTVTTGLVDLGAAPGDLRVLAERSVTTPRGHAEILTTLVLECLSEAGVARSDLDAVVVGCGPGPFTGLRVGMATAAAFADALSIPLHGVCSLDAIAAHSDADDVVVVTDARRREVYWARYHRGDRVEGPAVSAPAQLHDHAEIASADEVLGSPEHAAAIGRPGATADAPDPAGLVGAAWTALTTGAAPEPVVPLYLRRPDAVERAR